MVFNLNSKPARLFRLEQHCHAMLFIIASYPSEGRLSLATVSRKFLTVMFPLEAVIPVRRLEEAHGKLICRGRGNVPIFEVGKKCEKK